MALYRIGGLDVLPRITADPEKQFSDRDMYVFAFIVKGNIGLLQAMKLS